MEVKKISPELFGALFPSGNGPLGEKLQYVDLHFNGHYLWSTCDVLIHGWLNRIELAPRIVRTFWDSFSQWRCGIFISPKGCLMQWIRHYSERYWSCQKIRWKNWSGVLIWNKTVPFLPVKSSTGIKYPAQTIIFGYCPILLKIISQTNKYLLYDLQLGSYINLDTEHHPKFMSQFYRPGPHGNWKKVTSAPDNPLKGSNWIRNISHADITVVLIRLPKKVWKWPNC